MTNETPSRYGLSGYTAEKFIPENSRCGIINATDGDVLILTKAVGIIQSGYKSGAIRRRQTGIKKIAQDSMGTFKYRANLVLRSTLLCYSDVD